MGLSKNRLKSRADSNQKPTLEENLGCFRAFCLSLKAFFNLGSLKMICPNVNRPYLILWCLFLWIFQFLQFSHIFLHIFTQAFMTKGCKKCIPCNQLHFTGVKSVSYPITYAVRQRHNFQMSGCHGRLGIFFFFWRQTLLSSKCFNLFSITLLAFGFLPLVFPK